MQIPMLDLKREYEYMKDDINAAINTCLGHQRWILGPEVKELEEKIAAYVCVKHCIGLCSGTDALVLSLRALSIKLKGEEFFDRTDEIITTSFTFTASGDAILRSGATPVFVDIDAATYNMDANLIRNYLEQRPSSKLVGILPVHIYGQACDMDEIKNIANDHNLFVVEDVAQAFGGRWRDASLGSLGNTGAFSFFPSKNLGGFGDGGVITTNDDRLAELARMLLRHGGRDKYNVDHVGYNARIDTLQAAVVLAKLKHIDDFNERRKKIAGIYTEGLSNIKGLELPKMLPEAGHVFHQYTIRVPASERDNLQKALKEKGVSTMIYYPYPLHRMKVFGNGRSIAFGSLKKSEDATQSVLSLPMEPLQTADETSYVIQSIKDLINK